MKKALMILGGFVGGYLFRGILELIMESRCCDENYCSCETEDAGADGNPIDPDSFPMGFAKKK